MPETNIETLKELLLSADTENIYFHCVSLAATKEEQERLDRTRIAEKKDKRTHLANERCQASSPHCYPTRGQDGVTASRALSESMEWFTKVATAMTKIEVFPRSEISAGPRAKVFIHHNESGPGL